MNRRTILVSAPMLSFLHRFWERLGGGRGPMPTPRPADPKGPLRAGDAMLGVSGEYFEDFQAFCEMPMDRWRTAVQVPNRLGLGKTPIAVDETAWYPIIAKWVDTDGKGYGIDGGVWIRDDQGKAWMIPWWQINSVDSELPEGWPFKDMRYGI